VATGRPTDTACGHEIEHVTLLRRLGEIAQQRHVRQLRLLLDADLHQRHDQLVENVMRRRRQVARQRARRAASTSPRPWRD